MPIVPMQVNGRMRLVSIPGDSDAEDAAEARVEQARREDVHLRRQFVEGVQYDAENWARHAECNLGPDDRLPEHERRHAYSVQIAECVSFIADQLADGFNVVMDDPRADETAQAAYRAADRLTSGDDDELVCRDVLHDALTAGDVAYEIRWDPANRQVWPEFWESEHVQFDMDGTHVERVIRDDLKWVDDEYGERQQVVEKVVYDLVPNVLGIQECRRQVFWSDDEVPRDTAWMGLPFIPWGLLRGQAAGLRAYRGESIITQVALDAALRYDGVEQLGYKIARYNSHGNLAVVGDQALLQIKREENAVQKDVADVLTFPGGTALESITLPTDAQMINQQRAELAEGIYKTFGLTRVEPETLGGLGGISGYALEILNRKSEGTFARVRKQWQKDWRTMTNMILDVSVYAEEAIFVAVDPDTQQEWDVDADEGLPDGVVVAHRFDVIDPQATYPRRDMDIRLGSGYIVDDVSIRDDYTSGLISRSEALRQRGYTDEQIDTIEGELGEENPSEGTMSPQTRAALEQIGAGQNTFRATVRA